jgi:hypothetical protein
MTRMGPETHLSSNAIHAENYPQLHVVVTCTHRKRLVAPPRLRVSSIRVKDVLARGRLWVDRVRDEPAPELPASDLYAGDHWQVALSLLYQTHPVHLWVASAGYGLVRLGQQLKPYSATFSPGPDSVLVQGRREQRDAELREWWDVITKANLGHSRPRTLRELAASHPRAILLVALSEPYVRALHDDLVAARTRLHTSAKLLIVSAGTKHCPGLDENLLPVDASLQIAVGGPRLSLNARIARHLVTTSATHRWAISAIRESLSEVRSASKRHQSRSRLTDAKVIAFIKRVARRDNHVSRSDLLRRLRTQGFACEQQRFASLFARSRAT